MKIENNTEDLQDSSIALPIPKTLWFWCIGVGMVLWTVAVVLWMKGTLDTYFVFYFNDLRIAGDGFLVTFSQWLSSYGMATIDILYVLYLAGSYKMPTLDAPRAINFYVISSFAISGIAGDLLKEVISRSRPMAMFPDMLTVFSSGGSPAMPSGHATKVMALALPFVLLVSNKSIANKIVKALVALIAMGVVISRVVLGAHYVSDVIAGMGMAFLGFPFSMLFAKMVINQVDEKKLPQMRIVWGVLLIALIIIFMMI